MARTVALSVGKIKEEDGIQILEIAASNGNQHYCNPDKGCVICEGDNGVETSITKGIEVPGAICRSWKDPISEKYSYIKTAVKDVLGVYLTNDDESVKFIEYHMDDYKKIKEMSDNGSDYVEILNSLYSDFNINESTCIVHLSGNPSDSEKSEILSKILEQYPNLSSSRQIAVKTGLDSVGLPYFWGGGHGSIENLLDIVQNKWGVEYCTVTSSGSEKQTVGSSYLCGLDCYGFVRWTVYSATSSDPGSGFPSARINYRTSSNLLPGDWAYTDTHVLMFLYKDVHAHGADDGVIVSVYGSSVSYGAPIQFGS